MIAPRWDPGEWHEAGAPGRLVPEPAGADA
jgi:hypothetical protein